MRKRKKITPRQLSSLKVRWEHKRGVRNRFIDETIPHNFGKYLKGLPEENEILDKLNPSKSYFITGDSFYGKTTLACLFMIKHRKAVHFSTEWEGDQVKAGQTIPTYLFVCANDMLLEVQNTYSNPEIRTLDVLDKFKNVDVLLLDDLGTGFNGKGGVVIMYDVINHRYLHGKQTILTSNFALDVLCDDEGAIDERVFNRIVKMCGIKELKHKYWENE